MFHNGSRPRGLRNPRVLQDDDIPVVISQDFAIVATVSVGTPAQEFRCLLDSGSADLWLPSKRCESCSNEQYFDADASSTFSPKMVQSVLGVVPEKVWLQFASGPVAGFAVQDSIGFGPFQVSDHFFVLVEDADIPRHPDWDGICGLGWRGIARTGEPLYKKLQEMGHQAIFTFVPSSTMEASLVVGEVPTALAVENTFVWIPLEQYDGEDDRTFWVVRGGVSPWKPAPKNVRVVVDTGTNGILMVPSAEFSQLVEYLMPPEAMTDTCYYKKGTFLCDCRVLDMDGVPLQLELGGHTFNIAFEELFMKVPRGNGHDLCAMLVYASPVLDEVEPPQDVDEVWVKKRRRLWSTKDALKDAWVLGGSFLEHFIVALDFDQFRVGFAEPKQRAQELPPVLGRSQASGIEPHIASVRGVAALSAGAVAGVIVATAALATLLLLLAAARARQRDSGRHPHGPGLLGPYLDASDSEQPLDSE
jgi:hypothetical protein